MAAYSWPSREEATLIGASPNRLDGLAKATGAAKTMMAGPSTRSRRLPAEPAGDLYTLMACSMVCLD